jgi:hypothetical protein
MSGHGEIDEQIERLRKGNTLPENEVKALCEKVSKKFKKKEDLILLLCTFRC